VYGAGKARACSRAVINTGTSVLPQDVMPCFEGFDPCGFMGLGVLAGP